MNFDFQNLKVEELVVTYGLPILYALATLVIGWIIVGFINGIAKKALKKSVPDVALANFLSSIIGVLLKVLLFIVVASIVGIDTTSFAAIIGAAGLAIGLALQGSLSNFAGGVLILLLKPYKIGEFIEAKGMLGVVKEIQVFYTLINTTDNKLVIIPNGELSNSPIINYSREPIRRVDITIGIGYGDDIRTAKDIMLKTAAAHSLVLKGDNAPAVLVGSLGDSSVNIILRAWANTDDYWTVHNDLIEELKYKMDEAKIEIPFPQRTVWMKNDN
ncbi:small-conductance mechanosensitive channel [Bernardetia litoralis DSM 6794]|uniref:Small-conductance mechanosensitive channel n=1 Tax=Bernardetia litoralis (strain ATCC 23117 / DSM 6794 / NBRC 15988 / NCIMB 1366 / Fx l1 / Sio-4) TaxID=880071 RepID=I4AJV8_BERLS|nr:mechanosensitive ion channel family protein [Bernardetia litoralis]AFM04243.1 small-conductance mechanosensitive channel [Bernardetia litoralis DSM 6794]